MYPVCMTCILLVTCFLEATGQCVQEIFQRLTATQSSTLAVSCGFANGTTARLLECGLHCYGNSACDAFVLHNDGCFVCTDGDVEASLGLSPVTLNDVQYYLKVGE